MHTTYLHPRGSQNAEKQVFELRIAVVRTRLYSPELLERNLVDPGQDHFEDYVSTFLLMM
jgi:hypothetical protein